MRRRRQSAPTKRLRCAICREPCSTDVPAQTVVRGSVRCQGCGSLPLTEAEQATCYCAEAGASSEIQELLAIIWRLGGRWEPLVEED